MEIDLIAYLGHRTGPFGFCWVEITLCAMAWKRGLRFNDALLDLGVAVCRNPNDADLCGAVVDPR